MPAQEGAPAGAVAAVTSTARELSRLDWLVFACGRYEGVDERVLVDAARHMPVRLLSLGDYVLAGGEVAVLAMVEAVARLLPGVLGNAGSLVEESREKNVIVLLKEVDYINSSGFGELAELALKNAKRGRNVIFAELSEKAMAVFEAMGGRVLLNIRNTLQEALTQIEVESD